VSRFVSMTVLFAAFLGCAARNGESADEQRARGAKVYATHCVECHEGEGGVGAPLDAPILRSYGTASELLEYTRESMPYDAPGSLDAVSYRAVVAYLLESRGLVGEDVRIDEESAAEVRLVPE